MKNLTTIAPSINKILDTVLSKFGIAYNRSANDIFTSIRNKSNNK